MSVIICKDEKEVESWLEKIKIGFVTEDNRIYDTIMLGDDACYISVNAETLNELHVLQMHLEEANTSFGSEMSFIDIVDRATELEAQFKKVMNLIKYKPILRKKDELR